MFKLSLSLFFLIGSVNAGHAQTVIDTTPGNCSNLQVGESLRGGGSFLGQTFVAPEPILKTFAFEAYSSAALSVDDFEFRVLVTGAEVNGPFDVQPTTEILFESEPITVRLGTESEWIEVDFGGVELDVDQTYVLLLDGVSTIDGSPGIGGIRRTRCDNPLTDGHIISDENFEEGTIREDAFARQWNVQIGVDFAMVLAFGSAASNGDLDDSGNLDANDIDVLSAALIDGTIDLRFDLDSDGLVDQGDYTTMVVGVMQTFLGDANLDRRVDFADFILLAENFGRDGGWATGDFNGTLNTDFTDFLILAQSFGQSSGTRAVALPEPNGSGLLIWPVILLVTQRRRQRTRKPTHPKLHLRCRT